jgi:shikimate kinase
VVELVGPAGAGKSTLVRTIRLRNPEVRTDLSIWSLPKPRLVTNGLLFLPKLARLWQDYPGSLWTALHLAVRLKTLHQLLDSGETRNCRALVVDIGPIFTLAWFRVYARHRTRNRWLEQWYPRAVVEGAAAVDAIVWLDAPDQVLAHRIRSRAQAHTVKDKSDHEIFSLLGNYRETFAEVISEVSAQSGTRVLRFSTDGKDPEQIAAEIMASLAPQGDQ